MSYDRFTQLLARLGLCFWRKVERGAPEVLEGLGPEEESTTKGGHVAVNYSHCTA